MATTRTQHTMGIPSQQRGGAPSIRSCRMYLGLALVFALCVIMQAFLAGAGIFVGGEWMAWHSVLGHLLSSPIPMIPLLLIILSFVGRLPRTDKWLSVLLLLLTMVQSVLPYLRGVLPLLSALHPVNALLMFVLPCLLIQRVRRVMQASMVEPSGQL